MGNIEQYKGSFCVPGERIDRRTTSFGLYDSSGAVIEDSKIATSSWVNQPLPNMREPHSEVQIFGPAMFAGSVDKQFGYALLNSIGRLWALDKLSQDTVIVFVDKFVKKHPIYNAAAHILRSLGINNPILVLRSKTRFENLYVPNELFGEANDCRGTAEFYEWIDEKWGCKKTPKQGRKLYVTRSSLGPMAGRFACEDHLEKLLMDEGYEIYSPEKHTLDHQIETYLSADKIIFAEGSALHLFALIRQPHQVSAVIQRRDELPTAMKTQMADREGVTTLPINAITSVRFPPLRGGHLSRSEMDFSILKDELVKANFISGKHWLIPTEREVENSMRAGLAPDDDLMSYEEHRAWIKARRK